MYIQKIHIKNYRNFNDFEMEFHEGLNVIVGANNSGKTGLLFAIYLLNSPSNISIDDFNKNNLVQFKTLYNEDAPKIEISFIEKIYIGETEKYDGRKMQEVEIIYKFVGAINLPQYNSY